ncbi:hypothetical protein ACFQU7_36740 [Pseudoroseomonas wenyumeiae]
MQERIIGPFLDWVSYYQDWAGPVAFLLAFTDPCRRWGSSFPARHCSSRRAC